MHDAVALRAEFWALPDDAMVDRATVAAARYVGTDTMEADAIRGGGVPYTRIGRRALYRKADVIAWMAEAGRRVENTAQLASPSVAVPTPPPEAAPKRRPRGRPRKHFPADSLTTGGAA